LSLPIMNEYSAPQVTEQPKAYSAETEGGGAICDEGQAGRLAWVSGQVEKV